MLSHNMLSDIPAEIGSLRRMTRLGIASNKVLFCKSYVDGWNIFPSASGLQRCHFKPCICASVAARLAAEHLNFSLITVPHYLLST